MSSDILLLFLLAPFCCFFLLRFCLTAKTPAKKERKTPAQKQLRVLYRALSEGIKPYFINALSLIEKLKKAYEDNRFENVLRYYKTIELFIIDELGYLPLDAEGAKLFFELISQKYEKGSIIVTSNRSFSEWDKIFSDSVLATAVLDRLLHHSSVINIRGKSYRLKEKQKNGLIGAKVLEG